MDLRGCTKRYNKSAIRNFSYMNEGQMMKILIVDDDPNGLYMLEVMLKESGYEVASAANGVEALEKLNAEDFDLIITDLIMPEKEGLEIIMELRRDFPGVKIIAMSGGGRVDPVEYLSIAKNFGAQYTFTKPIERKELLNAVRELLK